MPNQKPHEQQSGQTASFAGPFLAKLATELAVMPAEEVVPPMYRLGDGENSKEVVIDGYRILSWRLAGNEQQLAAIAGWQAITHDLVTEEGEGYLFLPEGTRNARSILSGMEAYKGEKAAVIRAAAEYLKKAKRLFGEDDTQFSWTSLAITPEHRTFIAPPHMLKPQVSADEVGQWKGNLLEELSLMLQNDELNHTLVADFREGLKRD